MSQFAPMPLVIILLFAACLAASHRAIAAPEDPANAATWYSKAFEAYQRLSAEDRYLLQHYDPAEGPSPEMRVALVRAGSVLSHVQQASAQEGSASHFDLSAGMGVVIPTYTQLRVLARIVDADAMVRLHDGDTRGAAQRLAMLYRTSLHPGMDNIVVGSLVGSAIFGLASRGLDFALDNAGFGPDETAFLLREMKRIADRDDPCNYLSGVAGDHKLIVNWIGGAIGEPDAETRIKRLLGDDLFGGDNDRSDLISRICEMDAAEFDVAVQQLDRLTDRVIDAMTISDRDEATAAIARIVEQIDEGEFGPLAMLTVSWERVLRSKLYLEDQLAERIRSLSAIAQGEVDPVEVANAAAWYRRAIQMIEEFGPEEMELIRAFSAPLEFEAETEVEHTAGRKLEPLLLLSQDIIDVLRDGSIRDRCDFKPFERIPIGPAPDYAPGMRDALRLLLADALRNLRLGEPDAAADRLAIAHRVISHLSDEGEVVVSLLLHRAFLDAHAIMENANAEHHFNHAQRETIQAALRRIDIADPFGYLASYRTARERLINQMRHAERIADRREQGHADGSANVASRNDAEESAEIIKPAAADLLRHASDEDLLYYYALTQYSFFAPRQALDEDETAEAEGHQRQRIASLHDVFDLDAMMHAWRQSMGLAQRLRDGGHADLHTFEVRLVSRLHDRRARARADIRETSALVRAIDWPE